MKGRVIERNMMFTVLRERDGAALHVPNNFFFQKTFRVDQADERYLFEFLERGAEDEREDVGAGAARDQDASSPPGR